MEKFTEFELDSQPLAHAKVEQFGIKDVPNILMTIKNHDTIHDLYFDNIIAYYEQYDNINGWIITFAVPIISLQYYEILTQYNIKYQIKTDELYRSVNTGEDKRFVRDTRYFDHLTIQRKTTSEGDPATIYITLKQNPKIVIDKNPNDRSKTLNPVIL